MAGKLIFYIQAALDFRWLKMPNSLDAQDPFRPGTSVRLKSNPHGVVMTVLSGRVEDGVWRYKVAWLDTEEGRHEVEYIGTELMTAEK
eukprot:gene6425-7987_t